MAYDERISDAQGWLDEIEVIMGELGSISSEDGEALQAAIHNARTMLTAFQSDWTFQDAKKAQIVEVEP